MPEVDRSPRVFNVVEVECYTLDETSTPVAARMSDLSVTGAFLDSMGGLRPGTRLSLRFKVGDQDVIATAEVVHQMPQFGMGVRFIEMASEGRTAIEELIKAQA
jgi:PilZ domain